MASTTARRAALVLAGLAVTGGIAGVAGTAQAAAPATQPATTASNGGGHGWYGWNGDEDQVVAVFRSYRQCAWAARVGERRGYWEDADCDFVRTGYRGNWRHQWGSDFSRFHDGGGWRYRGVWVLRAEVCD
ncbi:hypothetical protein [Cryptosporangium arvum]|uniref:hypothetical protein n=1 Tax=Cryptosporangium arvum TaxID=80871 RepID=UPI0004ACFAC9|nr:hypothetical protein [Cryptosporangium arvum]